MQVMVATSGAQLLPYEAVTNLREQLLPLTTLLTPNIPEAKLILDNAGIEVPKIECVYDVVHLASILQRLGPKNVLIKGGHLPVDKAYNVPKEATDRRFVQDVLKSEDDVVFYTTDYFPSENTHGTGCSLACTYTSRHFGSIINHLGFSLLKFMNHNGRNLIFALKMNIKRS